MRKRAMLFFVCVSLLLASGGVINVISTNAVSNNGLSNHRWEPTSAAGSNWVQGWNEERAQNWVASWGSGVWNAPIALTPPNGYPSLDLTLAWDASRNRFVFAMLDNLSGTNHSVWYGFSNNAAGTSWSFSQSTPVMSSSLAPWDYPSVAVDGGGRVIVGAASESSTHGYFTIISTDGVHFTSPTQVSGVSDGRLSRLVATDNRFELFVPTLGQFFVPIAITRWESFDAVNWNSNSLATFDPPQNNSPGTYSNSCPNPNLPCSCSGPSCGPIFYAPNPDAKGFTNGLWIVGFAVNNGGYNNIMICTSNRGCGIVNSAADDQFLQGVSVSGDGGYWVSYYGYPSSARNLPLITQAIYFPTGGGGIGATTNTGIDPKSWIATNTPDEQRCPNANLGCFAAGDYQHIASNSFAAASTPFIEQSAWTTTLFQSFPQDPTSTPNVPNFQPNFISFPVGADLRSLGLPLSPQTYGVPPELRYGG